MPFSAIKAIKWARKKDYKVFLATGRSKCEIFDYILDIGFDGIVGAAGGYVEVEEIQKVIDFKRLLTFMAVILRIPLL